MDQRSSKCASSHGALARDRRAPCPAVFAAAVEAAPQRAPTRPLQAVTSVRTRYCSRAATSPAIIQPNEKPAISNSISGGTRTLRPEATKPASTSVVCGSGGVSESPNPGMSGATTRKLLASGAMFRIQRVHEPLAPWSSTSGRPPPQTRQTIKPVPHGVSLRIARDSILVAETAGVSSTSGVIREAPYPCCSDEARRHKMVA